MSAMNRRMASRRAKDRHWALLGAVAAGVAGMGLASQVHAQDVPDVPVVRTATLAGFLPAADPGLEFVDAASAMPADVIRQSLPDALGRQWLNVSRTYWSYPIPGLGALPPESSGLLAVPENVLHHIEAAFMAHPGGAGTAAGAGVSILSTAVSYPVSFLSSLIPPLLLVTVPLSLASSVVSLVATPLLGGAGGFANALIDYAPGVPPVYQVSIDYFKVGTLQPAISEAVHGALDPLTDPLRATVGGAVHSVTDPLRATLRSAADQVLNPVKDAVSGATGSACRLVYTEAVNLSSGDAAQASWPPAVETGFDCGGVMNRRMCIDVGAGFAGGAGADATPMKCDPLSSRLLESYYYGGIDFGPGMITWLGDAEGAGVLPILFDPSQEGAGMIPILFDPTKSQLFDMFLPYTVAIGWPAESLVVSIDSVKSSEDLHRLAQSIDYRGLCLAVHPDGEGCPSQ